ncbi:MAG: hypothetical protein V3T83_20770 [Acidobacteriota bacterium]
MKKLTAYALLLAACFFGGEAEVRAEGSARFDVVLDDIGYFPIGTIKALDDQVYVHVPAWRRLHRYDSAGNLTLDVDLVDFVDYLRKTDGLGAVSDFTVSSEGMIILAGPGNRGGAAVVFLKPDGTQQRTVIDSDGPEIFQIGESGSGRLCALGLNRGDEEELQQMYLTGKPTRDGISYFPVLHFLDKGNQRFHQDSGTRMLRPKAGPRARAFLGALQTSTLARDGEGNLYFVWQRSSLAMLGPSGGLRILDPPKSKWPFRMIETIVSAARGVLVVVTEGINEAPEEERQEGLFILRNPVSRVFRYESKRSGFQELYLEKGLGRLVGEFSDGTLIHAIKRGPQLRIAEFQR